MHFFEFIFSFFLLVGCRDNAPVFNFASNTPNKNAGAPSTPMNSIKCGWGNASSDGCSQAPTENAYTFKNANFFSGYAQQSGQSYLGFTGLYTTHPIPWNGAGIDYPVGVNASVLPLMDATQASTWAGTPCSYNSTRHEVICQNDSGQGVTINGIDFSPSGNSAGYSVSIQINSSVSGPCVISNSNFVYATNAYGTNEMVRVAGCISLSVLYNKFDGNGDLWTSPQGSDLVTFTPQSSNTGTTQLTAEYNAFLHCPARCLAYNGFGNIVIKYNYHEGLAYVPAPNGLHGESQMFNNLSGNTLDTITEQFNTFLQPADTASSTTANMTPYEAANIAAFTASISGTVLTVTAVSSGVLAIGQYLNCSNPTLVNGTMIVGLGTGAGGVGTYILNTNQRVRSVSMGATPHAPHNTLQIDHNVLVTNLTNSLSSSGPGLVTASVAGVGLYYGQFTTVNIQDNYVDPTGAYHCFINNSPYTGTINMSGNFDLLNASAIDFLSISTSGNCYGVAH